MSVRRVVRVVVASPGDVAAERKHAVEVIASLNRGTARERNVVIEPWLWEPEARPGFHPKGPQGSIDPVADIANCEILVAMFWKRFGTPIPSMGGQTGTQHEIETAIAAWRATRKPEIMLYFNEADPGKMRSAEALQYAQARQYYEKLPAESPESFLWTYDGPDNFKDKLRDHLENYLRQHYPMGPRESEPTLAEETSRYIASVRKETAHIEVQGLTVGESKAYQFPIEEMYIELATMSHAATVSLDRALSNRKLLVVGDPGSGKSTFLRHVAHDLCVAAADKSESARLPFLIGAAALANIIVAKSLAHSGPAERDSPDWIPVHLESQCTEHNRALPAEFFRRKMRSGECSVLIDGLDETDEASRANLVELVKKAAGVYQQCKFVVTSRPEGKPAIAGFEETVIAGLEPEAIRSFLVRWSDRLYAHDPAKSATFRRELERAVSGRMEIRRMTRNPVMLTALAVLQHNNVTLPEERVALYDSILAWLSKARAKAGRLPADVCLEHLRKLALAMQRDDERRKQAPLYWAGQQLAPQFSGSREAAEKFIRAEQSDSGIVVSRGENVAYWHLTFQEFLAAREMVGLPDAAQRELLHHRLYRPEWRETVLLYAGLLRKQGPERAEALFRQMLEDMGSAPSLADRARCVGLIGLMLRDMPGYVFADKEYEESLRRVLDIFDAKKSKAVPFKDRLAAAEALGQAGDPRIREYEMVEIPASKNVPAFRIGKYLVTVQHYQRFMDDDGYQREDLWSAGGFGKTVAPWSWDDQQAYPNRPVIGVNWHDASAWCKWKGGCLPSEPQWVRAVSGSEGHEYPWGDEKIDPSRANLNYKGSPERPTPVGLYPQGASKDAGVHDLIGNVWEWTCTPAGGHYALLGGSCYSYPAPRPSFRVGGRPGRRIGHRGFRLAWGIT